MRKRKRLIFVEHVVGHVPGITREPESPIAHKRRQGVQLGALFWTVEGDAGQAGIERAVFVLHDHDAITPTVEGEIIRRRETTGISSVWVVYEDAVAVA